MPHSCMCQFHGIGDKVPTPRKRHASETNCGAQGKGMFRLVRYLLYAVVMLLVGAIGYAYLGDMTVPQREIVQPLEIHER